MRTRARLRTLAHMSCMDYLHFCLSNMAFWLKPLEPVLCNHNKRSFLFTNSAFMSFTSYTAV